MIDKVPMEDRDTKGDLYEYMLGKIASAGQNGQSRTPRHIIRLMVEMKDQTGGQIAQCNLPAARELKEVPLRRTLKSFMVFPIDCKASILIASHTRRPTLIKLVFPLYDFPLG